MTGITAGVENDDVYFDDVIIAESVADYTTGNLEEDEAGEFNWQREIHQVNANSSLLSTATSVTRDSSIRRDINNILIDKNLRNGRSNAQTKVTEVANKEKTDFLLEDITEFAPFETMLPMA